MFTVVALGPVTCLTNGNGSQLTTVNIEVIIYYCVLKIRNIISKNRRSKVADFAALMLTGEACTFYSFLSIFSL